jgi:hypothetical protein
MKTAPDISYPLPPSPANALTATPTIDTALAKSGLTGDGLLSLREKYAPIYESLAPLAAEAREILPTEPKKARALRLKIKDVRCSGDAAHKALKVDILLRGRAIDGMQSVLDYACKPMEAALEEIEKAEERAEAKRKADLHAARCDQLRPFMDPTHMDLGSMVAEAFDALLGGAKAAHQKKIDDEAAAKAAEAERQRIAEEQRVAKAEADRLERERIEAENKRLAAEVAKNAAEAKKKAAAAEAEQAKEREAQRVKDEAAAAERQRLAAQAEAEKRKRELAEAESLRLKNEAEAKAKAEGAAKRKAARAPDKEKVAALAAKVRDIQVPKFTSEDGAEVGKIIGEQIAKMAAWLETQAEKLS